MDLNLKQKLNAALFAGALLLPLAAQANTVIDFTGVAISPPAFTFTSFSQGGFTVTAQQSGWTVAPLFGNPGPDISWAQLTTGSVAVTADSGATFTFVGLDMASAARSASHADYLITGFLAGNTVFKQSGSVDGNGPLPPFVAVASAAAGTAIDTLELSVLGGTRIAHLDNIVLGPAPVATVPEPTQASMFALGVLALVTRHRRARRALK